MALVGSGNSLGGIAGSNAVARLLVVISGNSAGLSTAIAQANGSIAGLGSNASSIGKTLTRTATLPLLALGGVAVKMASDFQTAMGRVAGLTTIFDDEQHSVEEVTNSLLKLSQTVPTSPVDLANSLYYAGSAGLAFDEAMQVVTLSAKGAAIGMGDAADISRVLIAAINNFGPEGLTAAKAMDALTVAIKEGTAEPQEMAIALGRLLPVAHQAGVSFEEVVGAVASLTNVGVPARVATTSLRALFSELLAPTEAAKDKLHELGLTSIEVANALRTSPIVAFKLLENAVHGDNEALYDIIPQIRGITAYFGVAGERLQTTKEIMDATTHSSGALDKAFEIISQTPQFKFDIALNKARVAAISLGNTLIPVFLKIVDIIGAVADQITGLAGPARVALAGFIVLGAAAGPVLQLYGALTKTREAMYLMDGTVKGTLPTWGAVGTGFITAGIAAITAVSAFQSLASGSTSLVTIATALIGTTLALTLAIKGLSAVALTGKLGAGAFGSALAALGPYAIPVAAAIAGVGVAIAVMMGRVDQAKRSIAELSTVMLDGATAGQSLQKTISGIKDAELRATIESLAKAAGVLNQPTGEAFTAVIAENVDELQGNVDQLTGSYLQWVGVQDRDEFAELMNTAAEAAHRATEENISFGTALREAGVAGEDLIGYLQTAEGGIGASAALAGDTLDLVEALYAGTRANEDYQTATLATVAAHTANTQAVEDMAKHFGVSIPYMQAKLDGLGVSAVGAGEEATTAIGEAAFNIDGSGDKISGAAAEMADAVTASMGQIAETIGSSFDLFSKIDPGIKKTTGTLLKLADQQARTIVQEQANLRTLAERGVPTDLLAKLAEQGPAVLEKFVNASDGQLRRLETSYQIGLAAIDNDILQEAGHQEVKGKDMVAGFADAILGSHNLTADAATKIVTEMGDAFAAGRVSGQGLGLVSSFVRSLASVKGLSQQEGSKAAAAFAQGVISGNFVDHAGNIIIQKLVNALRRGSSLTRQQATDLAHQVSRGLSEGSAPNDIEKYAGKLGLRVAEGVESKKPEVGQAGKGIARAGADASASQDQQFHSAGAGAGAAFANGLKSSSALAAAAARSVAASARAAFDAALKNSPEYFTYYMGRKLMDDMGRGLKDGHRALQASRPNVTLDVTGDRRAQEDSMARAIARGIREGQGDTVVQIDGREVVRAGRHQHMRRHG